MKSLLSFSLFVGIFFHAGILKAQKNYDPFGVDIVTGGHLFQITLTNSRSMRENGFIANTIESWTNGGIHIGFNISRTFDLYK